MGLHAWFDQKKTHYQDWKKRLVKEAGDQDQVQRVLGSEWNELGFHRTIAGFFYTIGLLIPQILLGILLLPLIQYTELRSPDISGMQLAGAGVFGAVYAILDLNTGDIIDRFVPEYLIKDPQKAMSYASFFIKYQMWSGLFQIAFVPLFCFTFIDDKTAFAYLAWYLIFISIQQYPATLGFFQNLLNTFQRYNKANLVGFYDTSLIQPLTKLGGGVLGLIWGQANPAFGEIYGMVIGIAIGGYVDDFFTFALGTYWLSKILDQYGIKIRDLYGRKVPREVWRSALGFASRFWPGTIFGALMGFTGFMITVSNLPGYITIAGLVQQSSNFSKFAGWSGDIMGKSRPIYSEAINNGKYNLTRYYIAQGFKYWAFFWFFLGLFNIFATPVIVNILIGNFISEEWALIGAIIPIQVLLGIWGPFNDVADKLINITRHPEFNTALNIGGTFVNLFFTWFFLAYLRLGWVGYLLQGVPMSLIAMVARFTFMQKKILRLDWSFWKDVLWQIYVAPACAGFIFVAYQLLILYGLWPIMSAGLVGMEILAPALVLLVLLMTGLMVIYIPLYGWFGGWDEHTMRDFRKSVPLSGPSLFIVYPMYKMFVKFSKNSPFKRVANWKIGDRAFEELLELGKERSSHIPDEATA